MKRLIYTLCLYSQVIIYYVFWIYFAAMILFRSILDIPVTYIMACVFFLLLGMYLGTQLIAWATDYLKKNNPDKGS